MSGEIDIATLKNLLGHKDIKMTLRYAHLPPAHNRKQQT
jgi:site-specific recombinase XerD